MNKLLIKMTNAEYQASIVCTINFVSKWMNEGFTATGYAIVDPSVSVMDVNAEDIPNNLYTGK